MKNKGFTLVELLAVIIVLGVISIITINVVTNNIETTKKKTFEVNAIRLLEAAKEYVTKEMENNDFPEDGIEVKKLNMKNNPFFSGIVRRNTQEQIILENVTDGNYCANGIKSDLKITKGNCEKEDDTAPTLKIKELKTTTTKTQIMIKTQDNGSGISYYEYCINDSCEKVEKTGTKEIVKEVVTIKNLEPNKKYKIIVKSVNGKEQSTIADALEIKTKEIEEPTFKISSSTHATTKELTITYPSVEEGYVKKYEIYKSNEENSEEFENVPSATNNVTTMEEKLVINSVMKVVAYIGKEENNNITKIVKNEIIISGIDLTPPNVNVLVPNIDSWTKTKMVEIVAKDEGVGLALRPYSYDGGKTWVKENKKEYKTATMLDIKVRDRLGNITEEFSLNGNKCFENGKNLCYINKVDSLPIDINIEVINGTLKNNYYINTDLYIKVTLNEYYLYNNEKTTGGSGIKYDTLKIKKVINNSTSNIKEFDSKKEEPYNAVYTFKLTEMGSIIGKIEVSVSDGVGNTSSKKLDFKLDRVTPTISPKQKILGLEPNKNYDFKNNVTYKFGPSGGKVTCNPANNNVLGNKVTVTCTAKGTNDLSATTTFEMDKVTPTITPKEKTLGLEPNKNYDFKNNVTYKFGPTGGKVTCNPANNNVLGNKKTVTCTAKGTNGLSATTTFEMDKVTPTITPIQKTLGLTPNQNYNFINNVKYTFGPTGGKVTCNPANNITLGSKDVTVTCTAKGTNGFSATTTFKTDKVTPTITPIQKTLGLEPNKNYDFKNNVKYTFGPSGGKVTCNPSNNNVLGNKVTVTCTATGNNTLSATTTFNMDKVTPTINVIKPLLGLKPNENYDFKNNVTYKFGPTGGKVTCNPANNNILGNKDVTVTCTATGTNGFSSSANFEVKHQVGGTPYECIIEENGKCEEEYYNCVGYFEPDTGGNTVSCSCGSESHRVGTSDPSSYMGTCCKYGPLTGTCYKCPEGSSNSNCPAGTPANICCY